MGTRSAIANLNEDGTVTSTYCHYDGYLEHNGEILKTYYNTPDKAEAVASSGYLSALTKDLRESINRSVHREEPDMFKTEEEFWKSAMYYGAEFLYLYDGEGWKYFDRYGDKRGYV